MAIFNNSIIPAGAAAADDVVTKSLRVETDAYLSFTPSSATTTRTKAVINFWFKLAEPEAGSTRACSMFTAGTVQGTPTEWFGITYKADTAKIVIGNTFGSTDGAYTTAVFRDYGAWYNLHLIADTTESADADKLKLYINGVLQTLTGTIYATAPLYIGDNKPHRFSWQTSIYHSTTFGAQMYIANAYLLENSTLPYTTFVEEDTTTGQLKPKATSGLTFGTNGFHLDFEDSSSSSTIGNDVSGNDNDFAATNLVPADIVNDTPTENYCVLNALQNTSSSTLSEGNLKSTWVSGSGFIEPATIGATSGKFYFEVYKPDDSATTNQHVGIARADTVNTATLGYSASTVAYMANESGSDSTGFLVNDYENTSTNTAFGSRWDNGEYIIQCAFDAGTGKVWFGVDNTWQDDTSGNTPDVAAGTYPAVTLTGDEALMPALRAYGAYMVFNGGSDPTFAGNKTSGQDTSQSEFYYEPPSGFVALSAANLPTPTIAKPKEHFDVLTYSGDGEQTFDNGSTTMQPDLVWVKARGDAYDHQLTDSVRGVEKYLSSNSYDVEDTDSEGLTAFSADGFTVGTGDNYSTSAMVAWAWKAGTDPSAGGGSSYTYTLTLTLEDSYGDGWGDTTEDTPHLKVYEGATLLGTAWVASGSSLDTYTINTNNINAIKIVWVVDGSDGAYYDGTSPAYDGEQSGSLKNGATTIQTDWTVSDTIENGTVWITQSSTDDEATLGTLTEDAGGGIVESYNADAGFSIVKWTGNDYDSAGTEQTINHNLGVAPEMIIVKGRTDTYGMSYGWGVYHKDLAGTDYLLFLNSTDGESSPSSGYSYINDIGATSVDFANYYGEGFNYGGDSSYSADTYVAYLFASVEGYSKVGSFSGSSSAFVYTGFRPSFILAKRSDSTGNWLMFDDQREGYNVDNDALYANDSGTENTTDHIDLLSNGFRIRTSNSDLNTGTVIYYAVGQSLKYANAR